MRIVFREIEKRTGDSITSNQHEVSDFLFQEMAAVLADYRLNCIGSADNGNSADLLALRMDCCNMLPLLPESRLTLASKYEGKGLWMVFPVSEVWFLLEHDRLRDVVGERTRALENKWLQQGGLLS